MNGAVIAFGECFAAGYVSGLLDGLARPQRLLRAAATGALATTRVGDCDAMPSRGEVDAMAARHRRS